MKKNNPNYYSLEFHDKQVTLNEYATWDSVDFDISGIVGNAAGIAKSLGSAALSMTQLTGYLVKNLAIALTPEEYRKKIREEYEELKKKIQIEKSKKGFWNTFVDGMSKDSRKVFRRIEDNISSLDRRSQQMFRDAGLSESQTLALLFSTNPAIVLADYLKIKFKDDPRSKSADKTIDSIEKAIANSLIDSIKGRKGKDNVIKHCKTKIINGSNIEAEYVILKDLQNLIAKWIDKNITPDSSKILYNISSKSLIKTSTVLKNNASNNNSQASLDLIKTILEKINSQKSESSNQFNLMFNNTSLLLTEASSVTATKSVLFNSIAWLILETSNADLLKEEMDILN